MKQDMERLTLSQYVLSTQLEKGKLQPSHSQMVKEIKFNLWQLYYPHADNILLTDIDEAISTVIKLFTTISRTGAFICTPCMFMVNLFL